MAAALVVVPVDLAVALVASADLLPDRAPISGKAAAKARDEVNAVAKVKVKAKVLDSDRVDPVASEDRKAGKALWTTYSMSRRRLA